MITEDSKTDRYTDRQTNRPTDRQTNRPTDRQTDRQTDLVVFTGGDEEENRRNIFKALVPTLTL